MPHAPIFTIQEIIVNSWKSHDGCQSNGSLKTFSPTFFFLQKRSGVMRTYKDMHLPFAFNSFVQFPIIYSMHTHFFSTQDFSLMEIVD